MDPVALQALAVSVSVLVLAMFVGFEVISKVPTTLHTPLMSGSNAISGVILIGALLVSRNLDVADWNNPARYMALAAVFFAMLNVVGGFFVTDRMLAMFSKKKGK